MVLRTMINPFGMINDLDGNQDELIVSIYSDVMEDMFTCSKFKVTKSHMIDFKGLTVPCSQFVIVTLTEKDWLFNDGNSIVLSCRPDSS